MKQGKDFLPSRKLPGFQTLHLILYSLVAKEKIPHVRVSKRTIRFGSSVLEEWIKSVSFAEKRRE